MGHPAATAAPRLGIVGGFATWEAGEGNVPDKLMSKCLSFARSFIPKCTTGVASRHTHHVGIRSWVPPSLSTLPLPSLK